MLNSETDVQLTARSKGSLGGLGLEEASVPQLI